MGGAVGLLQNDQKIPKEIMDKILINRDVKRQIAQKDAKYLKKQLAEPWKPHKEIIKLLTERTKHQLGLKINSISCFSHENVELITYIFSQRNRVGGYHTDIADELLKLGGVYGEFLRLLVTREFVIDAELIDTALNSLGCDEELIAEVLCTSSDKDLASMIQYYGKWKGDSLLWKLSRKTVPESPFSKFVKLLIQNPCRQSVTLSPEVLAKYADDLLQNGLGSNTTRNDEVIFPILLQTSRAQCQEISDILVSKCHKSLAELIRQKYKGTIGYSLLLWIDSTLFSAQAQRLNNILSKSPVNKLHLSSFLAKYDRNTLIDILNRCDELYPEANMENKIYASITGHHREAADGWINNHTCDGDHENAIKEMLLEYELNNEVLNDEAWMRKLTTHLDGENAVLAKYVSVHKVDLPRSLSVEARLKPLPPGSKRAEYMAQKSHSDVHQDQSHVWNSHPSSKVPSAAATPRGDDEVEWNRKCKLVLDLLAERFAVEDIDHSGTLDALEFWNILTSLNVGYSEQEIKDLQEWIDSDKDDHITYDEVVVELAESIVSTIEERSGMSVDDKVREIREACTERFAAAATAAASQTSSTDQNLAPDIITYLKDTFDAVDTDKNGTLDAAEFWNILVSVLQLTEGDKQILSMEWDDNGDGKISWVEALDEFNKIFRSYIQENRDHWIGLVDKNSQKYFWYNLKDNKSYWMSEEDENYFRSLVAQGADREEAIKPLSTPM